MTDRETMKMALEVLERASDAGYSIECEEAITALRQALAQPEQELDYPPECTTPEMEVAYAAGWWKALEVQRNKQQALDKKADNARELGLDYEPEQERKYPDHETYCGRCGACTYKPWVGLTDDEKNNCLVEADPCEALATPESQELMRTIEAKLREKNG